MNWPIATELEEYQDNGHSTVLNKNIDAFLIVELEERILYIEERARYSNIYED